MAHFATKRFSYWGQLGILAGLCGAGLLLAAFAMLIPFIGKIDMQAIFDGTFEKKMKALLLPENRGIFRWSQSIGAIFLFLVPVTLYARIAHVKMATHLGFKHSVTLPQVVLVILIMLAALPAVNALQELTMLLPWSKSMLQRFKEAEDAYNQQVLVITAMNNVWDYITSLIVIALFPAVLEEMLFRGSVQNLLSRWLKQPIVAIVITSIVFSAVHGSYQGFLSRFALSVVLGWMYYKTGNIWLNIIGHFFNNAAAVTALYVWNKMDEQLPLWTGLLSVGFVIGLFIVFEKVSRKDIDRPGEEALIPGYNYNNNPFDNDITFRQESNQ